MVTVMFAGTIVCAWGCRRRLVPMMRQEERVVSSFFCRVETTNLFGQKTYSIISREDCPRATRPVRGVSSTENCMVSFHSGIESNRSKL